jgi:methionyl-tRNA synthetase
VFHESEITRAQGEKACPNCLDFDFEEAEQCENCKAWFFADELENGVCNDCTADLVGTFKELLYENFTANEIKILNEIYDGKEF